MALVGRFLTSHDTVTQDSGQVCQQRFRDASQPTGLEEREAFGLMRVEPRGDYCLPPASDHDQRGSYVRP